MILLLLVIMIYLYFNHDNYTNYTDYDKLGESYLLNCPEQYEIGIGEISKLRNQRPSFLLSDFGYTKNEYFDITRHLVTDKPLPSPPDLFKK